MDEIFVPQTSPTSTMKSNEIELSVSEISVALKRTVEDRFSHVRVRGEISGYRGPHTSGHAYFALKDENARLDAVIWRSAFSRLKVLPSEGMEVIATGRLTTYSGSSRYQIVIESLSMAGLGASLVELENRRKKLADEGLFSEEKKQPLPFMPRILGVVTSPTGAVIRDIIHRITDRFPLHIVVWPVQVQGPNCGAEVSQAIAGFNKFRKLRPDIIIVARGGGSIEDLWGFNDEAIIRACYDSTIPIISAVGHETDWTLIDYVADRRAPTPTAAAEIAVPVREDCEATLAMLGARQVSAIARSLTNHRTILNDRGHQLPTGDQLFATIRMRFDETVRQFSRSLYFYIQEHRQRFNTSAQRLNLYIINQITLRNQERLSHLKQRMKQALIAKINRSKDHISVLTRGFSTQKIEELYQRNAQRLTNLSQRNKTTIEKILSSHYGNLSSVSRLLKSTSYQNTLARGFALVLNKDGTPIESSQNVPDHTPIKLHFLDGDVWVKKT